MSSPRTASATTPADGRGGVGVSARRRSPSRLVLRTVRMVLLVGLAALMMTPLVYSLLASVTPLDQLLSRAGSLLPERWEWSNYVDAWTRGNFARYFLNSVIVTTALVVADTIASSMTAYVLARRRLRGQRLLEGLYMVTLFIGMTTAMLYPQYQIAQALGLDNLAGITLVELAGVMVVHILLMKGFLEGLGPELEEAARLDGCGFFGIYRRIVLPLMSPILATTIILGFQASWNNYQVPLTFSLSAPELRTLVVGVNALQYDAVQGLASYNTVLAGANLALIPIVVVFLLLQRQFVHGWTEGAVKG
ncbi:carbohydrate ABC transporter permease [Georgenia alba]|uniref:Carbohydrate ABC transporter permease n=1 Tax=Georgenia alba TaxID=2233858 RepID=A0ABW2QAM2_9MICO